ncbi:GGDEF domain-containing protein [Teredinibacter purpureus]|uniref:GGDEF domain-containing protein n=1 Tax=Teredinibacter purpureus TaxID=2731756 RepID=UPI0005F8519F|nr:GGDEF domain-containing protein [Teredinibacter purpureus]
MVETPGGGYKEKYLNALDDQERQQKQFNFQMELLRKTISHLGAASQGLDKNLDATLLLLKEKMRGGSSHQVIEQMERVQQAVVNFERNREQEQQLIVDKLRGLLQVSLTLKLPKELRDKVKGFSKNLQAALVSYRAYPRVLGELTLLQQSALEAAMNPSLSFFQRIKSGRTLSPEGDQDPEPPIGKADEAKFAAENLQLAPNESAPLEHNIAPSLRDAGVSSSSGHLLEEDGYEQVATRIALTLRELMENIEPNDIVRHRVDMVRSRIERGMDWFSLSVTLEDIRDILMQRYLDVDREFTQYLQDVNKELSTISGALGLALEREAEANSAATDLSEAVSGEVDKIQESLKESISIDALKTTVNSHLAVIQDALTDYSDVQQRSSESVTGELRKLLIKVEAIEEESSKTKELLEEERYRATHDTLTGLPNREAYNERAFHELQRFQRYGHSLAIAVCDIDHFKKINDSFGHQAGDKVLKLIARVVSTRLRKVDFVSRYGGEEFVILLPETSPAEGKKALDKIRKVVSKAAFRFKDRPVNMTISFGITAFISDDSVESAFERADKALYTAKNSGRNCCVIAEAVEPEA